jgi:DNA-binding LacI/PurR family transcriptional regulator
VDSPRLKGRKRLTLREVSEIAGVSDATVSRALRDDPQISEATRRAVKRVADQLGYIPNATARSLAKRTSQTLGVLVPDVTDPAHGQFVLGFELEAAAQGYVILVSNSRYDEAVELKAHQTFLSNQADGIAVFSSVLDPIAALTRQTMGNVVLVEPQNVGALGLELKTGVIRLDDAAGIAEAVRIAVEMGHSRAGYLSGPAVAANVRRRQAAVRSLEEAAVDPLILLGSDALSIDAIAARIRQEGCDVVLCFDDQRAFRLLDVLRDQRIRVPEDVGVIGYDDVPFARISNPRLTTIAVPYQEIGAIACRMLLEQAASGVAAPSITVPVEFILRESLTPRPA